MLRKEQQELPAQWPIFARTMENDWGSAPAKPGGHSCCASWLTLNNDAAQILLYWNTVNSLFVFALLRLLPLTQPLSSSLLLFWCADLIIYDYSLFYFYFIIIYYAFQPLSPLLETPTNVLGDRLESCLFQSRQNAYKVWTNFNDK